MTTFNAFLLAAHVAGGVLALLVAPLAMLTRKGARWHVAWGRIYFWTMMWVTASALVLSCTKRFVFFLVGVTVLAFYDTFTGVRCLYRKGSVAGNARGRFLDWSITGAALLFGVTFVIYGLLQARTHATIATLHAIFGALLLSEVGKDVWRFIRPSEDAKWWWYYHMERMLGSWIAGLTALAVNQIGPRVASGYQIWVWIGPSLVVVPVVLLWVGYYKKKFTARKPAFAPTTAPL